MEIINKFGSFHLQLNHLKEGNNRPNNYENLLNFLVIFLTMLQIINLSSEKNLTFKKLNLDSEISMTIIGEGEQLILADRFPGPVPDKIYINGNYYGERTKKVNGLSGNENTIKMNWNSPLTTCSYMFFELSNIKNMDLSKFVTSEVTDMETMFYGCTSLTTIDLRNFNTSSVTKMGFMFYNCYSLVYLNLGNFNTSLTTNMIAMFCNCSQLTSLDLSSFDTSLVTNMDSLFHDCNSLQFVIINSFNTSLVNTMYGLFYNCRSLTSIDLSNFDTSLVTSMLGMFGNCHNLISLNLSTFDTTSVVNMEEMFNNCRSLVSLDLSNFDISKVNSTSFMFFSCTSLIFLNLNSFIENKIEQINVDFMFNNINDNIIFCLNIQNNQNIYNTIPSHLLSNNNCRDHCFSESIKIDTLEKTCIYNCENTQYKKEYNRICYFDCPENTHTSPTNPHLCIDDCEKINKYYNYNQTSCINKIPQGFFVNDTSLKTIDKCHPDCKECDKKYDENNSYCKSCLNDKFLYFGNCLTFCNNSYFHDLYGNKICKCFNNKCYECSIDSNKLDLCISCNKGYYPKIDDIQNNNSFIDCYKDPDGYYLENDTYKPCYPSCQNCTEFGDILYNKCISCRRGFFSIDNGTNCYKICQYYYYFNSSNIYHCTEGYECPIEQNKLIKEKNQCIKNCIDDDIYKCEFNNICYEKCPEEKYKSEIPIIASTFLNLPDILSTLIKSENNNYINEKITTIVDISDIENISDKSENSNNIKYIDKECPENMPYQLKNDKCVEECNALDFFNGICKINNNNPEIQENLIDNIKSQLKNKDLDSLLLNVTDREKKDLLIKAFNTTYQITTTENQNNNDYTNLSRILLHDCEDILRNHYHINKTKPLIIFKVDYYMEGISIPLIGYEVYHPDTKEKLELKYCQEVLIDYIIPVSIDENNLFKYDPNNEYYTDECLPYTTDNGTDIILNDRKEEFIINNWSLCENNCAYNGYNEETKKVSCKCEIKEKEFLITEVIYDKDILSNNFTLDKYKTNLKTMRCANALFTKNGLLLNIANYIMIINFIIFTCLFILFFKFGFYLIENDIEKIISGKMKIKAHLNSSNIQSKVKKKKNGKRKKIENKMSNPKKKKQKKRKILVSETKYNSKIDAKCSSKIYFNNATVINNEGKQNNQLNIFKKKKSNLIISKNQLYDSELNSLEYKLALLFDKRNYSEYYLSLIKTKHPLIFTFLSNSDYNIIILKISILIISYSIYFGVNTLFFNDSSIHQIYENKGKINISQQIPKIIGSFIISHIIFIFLKYFILPERTLLIIKYKTPSNNVRDKASEVKRCFFIKYMCFYIFGFVFIIFFWYYLSSFDAVYKNSQIYTFINTLISIIISLLYPLIVNLIPGIFRIPSLTKNKNNECFYKISKAIQFI